MPHDYDLHWTCKACGQPIDDTQGVVIIDHLIYHAQHQPSMQVINGEMPTTGIKAPDLIFSGDDW